MLNKELSRILDSVQKPGRYLDIELNACKPDLSKALSVALSFPDLYDIGMSNNAVRILYSMLNTSLNNTCCERVFLPFSDMESVLKSNHQLLFSLENQKPVKDFDILAFTIGYELLASNVLTILDSSGISLYSKDRNNSDPIILAGGPAISNPYPLSPFIDAFFIGDFEQSGLELFAKLQEAKENGAGRNELLAITSQNDYVWTSEKPVVRRAIWEGFSTDCNLLQYPLPIIDVVQDQGVVEIMRGCPNGCRFCHAGYYYRPVREKQIGAIIKQTDHLVSNYGYKEITLSSLSSGDYSGINQIVGLLDERYHDMHVSFNLPSLKVTSFSLDLLEKISSVRKSGLTFAIETPDIINQRALNKEVYIEQVIEILMEAKTRGWKMAKFYFMIGLPLPAEHDEAEVIVSFLKTIRKEVPLQYNVNIGTFVPKPHTAYERVGQLSEEAALRIIKSIREALPKNQFKTGYHSPFASILEGIISRGDQRVADLIHDAWQSGARLDAWEEHFKRDIWKGLLENKHKQLMAILEEIPQSSSLPWHGIKSGVSDAFFRSEKRKSDTSRLTSACVDPCHHHCGVCNDLIKVNKITATENDNLHVPGLNTRVPKSNEYRKLIFKFNKLQKARFISNINLYNMLHRVFQISGTPVKFTSGYNPKPKLEIVQPLSLGVESDYELAKIEIESSYTAREFIDNMNEYLPEGIQILEAHGYQNSSPSLSAVYHGSEYLVSPVNANIRDILLQSLSGHEYLHELIDSDILVYLSQDSVIKNIQKFLKESLETETPLIHCAVKRTDSYAVNTAKKEGRGDLLFDFFKLNFL